MDDAKQPFVIRCLPAFGICVPLLLAFAAHFAGPRPARILAAPVRPALALDQYLVDLGPVAPSEEIRAHFDFTNRGKAPLTVTDLVPSCGCLQPQMKKKTYRPGESGNFVVRVQTASENPGLKEYTITIRYTDPAPREVDVVFRVVLPDNQVTVRPRALAFYQLGEQGPGIAPQKIDVTDRRGRHLNITRVECSRDIADVELAEVDFDEAGHWHAQLNVTVPNRLPAGRVEATVHIFTDDPAYRMLRVPLIIEGGSPRKLLDPHLQPAGMQERASRLKPPRGH
jgi:hypothetical protein